MSTMIPDPIGTRARLRTHVAEVVSALSERRTLPRWETESVDFKEEAGRRDRSGELRTGEPRNQTAVDELAPEIRCFSNTPGGGAIVLGVDDKTHDVIGTSLDEEWLRQRLHVATGIAPTIDVHHVRGQRVLALLVAESEGPVEDPDHRLRWRVGDECRTVDRAEWWAQRAVRIGVDPMAAVTEFRAEHVTRAALAVARGLLVDAGDPDVVDTTDEGLLTQLGVLRPDGSLSQAGVLMFCPTERPGLELSRLDVVGGDVVSVFRPSPGTSLLEALREVEIRLDAVNRIRPVNHGLVEEPARALPPRAVREAILNGLTHRDWFRSEPTTVRWIETDDTLEVTSPGGFTGGVTPENALTTRHARYPALADLFQALRLVDRQGVGVPRMYQTMLAGGHRAPLLEEVPGSSVRTTLAGKPPVPVLPAVLHVIEPSPRRRDVRVAVVLDALSRNPFLTLSQAATALQRSVEAAGLAMESIDDCRVEGHRLFAEFRDVHLLSDEFFALLKAGRFGPVPPRSAVFWYRRSDLETVSRVAGVWLASHDRVTSGDVARLTGMWPANASKHLSALAEAGDTVARGPGGGRAAHFVRLEPREGDGTWVRTGARPRARPDRSPLPQPQPTNGSSHRCSASMRSARRRSSSKSTSTMS